VRNPTYSSAAPAEPFAMPRSAANGCSGAERRLLKPLLQVKTASRVSGAELTRCTGYNNNSSPSLSKRARVRVTLSPYFPCRQSTFTQYYRIALLSNDFCFCHLLVELRITSFLSSLSFRSRRQRARMWCPSPPRTSTRCCGRDSHPPAKGIVARTLRGS